MPNITCNSCYYLFRLQPEKLNHLPPCVYFRRVVSLRTRANWFWSPCFQPSWSKHWARSMYFSQNFGFQNFLLVLESTDFKIFTPFLRNSCYEIMWWFSVTIVTAIFTCRYFKLKGLDHAILGNFSIDQGVIELTEITKEQLKTIEELKQNTGKLRGDKDGKNWGGLKWIAFG